VTPYEHYQKAEQLLAAIPSAVGFMSPRDPSLKAIAMAQVHATLATVPRSGSEKPETVMFR
jgi:hypothetical protein